MMEICVCGWYYFPEFMHDLEILHGRYPVTVVAHRQPPCPMELPIVFRKNIGLEWGAFSYYVEQVWDKSADVLFMQDDMRISGPAVPVINRVHRVCADEDVVFIFSSGAENARNSGGHGRCVYMSSRFLTAVSKIGGLWYDKGNNGWIASGHYTAEKPPEGCGHHNAGIHHFMKDIAKARGVDQAIKVRTTRTIPEIRMGRRGRL
jgi:hypothetical protein